MLASDIFEEREHVMHGHSWTCLPFTGLSDCRIEDTHILLGRPHIGTDQHRQVLTKPLDFE